MMVLIVLVFFIIELFIFITVYVIEPFIVLSLSLDCLRAPDWYMHPPFLKYATKVKLSTGA